jgi:hypothetical protein
MCAVVSDSTGNTRLHCQLLVNKISTMFNLPDIIHFIRNTIKDIVKLEYFKTTISIMHGVITKFHKSHLGMAELSFAHIECHISKGLEKHVLESLSWQHGHCNTIYLLSRGLWNVAILTWGVWQSIIKNFFTLCSKFLKISQNAFACLVPLTTLSLISSY